MLRLKLEAHAHKLFHYRRASSLNSLVHEIDSCVEGTSDEKAKLSTMSEMSHLVSPTHDKKCSERIYEDAEKLFQKIPLPSDPMTTALKKTTEDIRLTRRNEVLIEAVRLRYQRMKQGELFEVARIEKGTPKYGGAEDANISS
ncbi:hypothetical protein XU18_1704 [Perkinsela sp. CCAP 1560/4]|nr:hypothetical protein XU18_1704 [Perkinsela sp. CCAP 1560/4]|eukprot:KNH07610.1 hypothetical protein XU18_1704 [Perkinsela sp. CCAP 1560/4]